MIKSEGPGPGLYHRICLPAADHRLSTAMLNILAA